MTRRTISVTFVMIISKSDHQIIPESIEITDSPVTFDKKIFRNVFYPNCPSGSKTSRIFQKFRVKSDEHMSFISVGTENFILHRSRKIST